MDHCDILIIGGGPAGATAALYAARAELATVVVDQSLTAGALGMTGRVENYPGLPEAAGPEIVRQFRTHAERFGVRFIQSQALAVDFAEGPKRVYTSNGDFSAQAVILATGAMGRGKRVPGEEELVGLGVSYCATCDGAFFRGQDVAVVGNSAQAVEEAEFLTRYASRVYLVSPTAKPRVDEGALDELLADPKVTLLGGCQLLAVHGDSAVQAIHLRSSAREETLPVQGVFIYLQGNRPATDFLGEALPRTGEGCLHVDKEMRTAIPGVYAVGDVLCGEIKQAVVAAAQGCIAAITAEKELRGRKRVRQDWK